MGGWVGGWVIGCRQREETFSSTNDPPTHLPTHTQAPRRHSLPIRVFRCLCGPPRKHPNRPKTLRARGVRSSYRRQKQLGQHHKPGQEPGNPTHPPTHQPTYQLKKKESLSINSSTHPPAHPPTHLSTLNGVSWGQATWNSGCSSLLLLPSGGPIDELAHPPTHPPTYPQNGVSWAPGTVG